MNFRVFVLMIISTAGVIFADTVPVTDGLIIHLDADTIVGLNDGDTVTSWADSATGDTVDGSVTNVSTGPTYVANALNGNAVVRLAEGQIMASALLTLPNVDDGLTYFVVATGDSSGAQAERVMQLGLKGSDNTGKCMGVDFSTNTSHSDGGSGARFNNGKALVKVNNPLTAGFHIAALQMDQGDSYDQLRYYVDDMTLETLDNVANPTNTFGLVAANNELTIGNGIDTSGTGYFSADQYQGDIAEILIYNSQLSQAQMQQVFDYLYNRYFVENLIIHLDAASLTGLNDGDTVTSWADIATADTVDGTVMPVTGSVTYQDNILKGNPVVRFDGSGYLASNALTLLSIDDGLTMFVVATGDQSNASAERAVQLGQINDNAGHILGVDLSINTDASDGGSGARFNNGKSLVKAGNPITTGFHIAILQMSQGQTYDTLRYYVDDLTPEVFNNTANPTNIFSLIAADNELTVGNGLDSSGAYYGNDVYQGDIAEILVYNSQLSQPQMQIIFDSLYEKYFSSPIVVEPQQLTLSEGQSDTLEISLASQPGNNVTVDLQDVSDPNQVSFDQVSLVFTTADWDQSQPVQVTVIDDNYVESENHNAVVLLTTTSSDVNFQGAENSVPVTIADNECGRWAYPQGDFNEDCNVDIHDFEVVARHWLWCDPMKDDLCMNLN